MKKTFYTTLMALAILAVLNGCSDDDDDDDSSGEEYTTHILIRGTAFNSTSSLNFDPAGNMFVVDVLGKKVFKTDPETGQILDTVSEGINGPADIDFAADGTMYWTNAFALQAYKRAPTSETALISTLSHATDGVAVNSEGRVFTASMRPGEDTLWELDPYGVQPPRLVMEKGGFDAFDFGPDGYLYAPDFLYGSGEIYKIDVNNGTFQVVTDGFCQPIALKFNHAGELHVMDYACPKVVKVDTVTGEHTLVANLAPMPDNFDFNLQDEMFVAFLGDSYLGKVLPDGTVENITSPGMSFPGSIAVRPDGSLFVANGFTMRRYNAVTGELEKTIYNTVPPFTLHDDGRYLIISCHLFSGVQVWDPDENKAIATYTDFQQPTNAIRFRGDIIVADMGIGSVVRVDDRRPLIEGLRVPAGLAANGDDLYVADRETGIVWQAVADGERLNPPLAVAESLAAPEGIAFDNEGRLLVVEVDKQRLLRIDLSSGERLVVAADLEISLETVGGAAPTWAALSDVAVAESGDLYVTGDAGNIIYRIEKNDND